MTISKLIDIIKKDFQPPVSKKKKTPLKWLLSWEVLFLSMILLPLLQIPIGRTK